MPKADPTQASLVSADFQAIFASEQGARVLRHLMDNFWMFTSSLPERYTSDELLYNEGQRSVVIYIIRRLQKEIAGQEYADEMTQTEIDYLPQTSSARG